MSPVEFHERVFQLENKPCSTESEVAALYVDAALMGISIEPWNPDKVTAMESLTIIRRLKWLNEFGRGTFYIFQPMQ